MEEDDEFAKKVQGQRRATHEKQAETEKKKRDEDPAYAAQARMAKAERMRVWRAKKGEGRTSAQSTGKVTKVCVLSSGECISDSSRLRRRRRRLKSELSGIV